MTQLRPLKARSSQPLTSVDPKPGKLMGFNSDMTPLTRRTVAVHPCKK